MGRFMVAVRAVSVVAVLAVGSVCWVGCGGDSGTNTGGGGDSYDYVTIGGLKWMKKNLNVETADSWCYGEGSPADGPVAGGSGMLSSSEIQANCNKYGRLYTWSAAKSACQSVGWRLPTREDWNALVTAVGGSTAGKALKSTSGWNNNGNGTDTYGFSALPGGYRYTGGGFGGAVDGGLWWTATELGSGYAYSRTMRWSNDFVDESDYEVGRGVSTRCVKDD